MGTQSTWGNKSELYDLYIKYYGHRTRIEQKGKGSTQTSSL